MAYVPPQAPNLGGMFGAAAPSPTFGAPAQQPMGGDFAMPQPTNGPNWAEIVKAVMPFVMGAVAGRTGGRAAAGAALMGYAESTQRERALAQQRMQAAADDARQDETAAFSRRLDVLKFDQTTAQNAAKFVTETMQQAASITNEAERAAYLQMAQKVGAQAYDISPEAWVAMPVTPNTAKQKTEAAALTKALRERHGEQYDGLVASGATVSFNGQQTALKDLEVLAGTAVSDPSGAPVYPVPKPVKPEARTDYGDFLARYAKGIGKTVEDLTSADEIAARKAWGQADDRPTASQQPTPSGLPPRVDSAVQAKSRAFGTETVVKETQELAKQVHFVNSLPNNTNSPADDQALIYAFAKVMDPNSVVRESEYATVQNYAQAVMSRVGFSVRRVFDASGFLTQEAREGLKATILKRYASSRKQYDQIAGEYARMINKITGRNDGADYLTDYAGGFPEAAPSLIQTAPPDQTGTWKWNGSAWVKK